MKRKHSVTRDYPNAARFTAAFLIVSIAAIVGIAAMAGAVAASHGGNMPDGPDLESDEFLVDDDFESGEVADDDQKYMKIQNAVDNASAGYTVYVREGDYPEDVTVDKRLDLIGAGMDHTNVTGGSVALTITGDDVKVHGFNFTGDVGDNVVEVLGTSSSEDVKNLEFSDNRVVANEDGGGLYHGPMDPDVPSHTQTVIKNNEFTVKPGLADDETETGTLLHVDAATDEIPHNITIEENLFTTPTKEDENTAQIDVVVADVHANNTTILSNEFVARTLAESGSAQLRVRGHYNDIRNNHVHDVWSELGIIVTSFGAPAKNNNVQHNQIHDARGTGIVALNQKGLAVHENDIDDTDGPGIIVSEVTDSRVTNNEISNSDDSGIVVLVSENVLVDENSIVNTHSIGLWVFDSTGVTVEFNYLDDNEVGAQVDGTGSLGQFFGGPFTADGDSSDVLFENNEFVSNSDVGLNVSDFLDTAPAEDHPAAHFNDFSAQDHDVRNLHEERIDARLNWFGDDDEDIKHLASIEGDVLYDPFLTDEPGDVIQNMDETEQYAHDFTLDASEGTVHVIAAPGPADRDVGDAFDDLPPGTQLWAYDNQNKMWTQPSASDDIHDLDAFVVTGLDSDATIVFGFAGNGAASPSNADLADGWNLVGAPRHDDVDGAFHQSAATITSVVHNFEAAGSMPAFMNYESAAGTPRAWQSTIGDGDDNCVSPYTGYWAYVDDDDPGGLPSNLNDGVSFNDAIDLLRTDTVTHPCGGGD